ncbi:hypothetical protein NHQ30_002436 [Ciborinia camelliae]|nr:hypothetical protein NHQ30_002436 [Ciborinia camelliae]
MGKPRSLRDEIWKTVGESVCTTQIPENNKQTFYNPTKVSRGFNRVFSPFLYERHTLMIDAESKSNLPAPSFLPYVKDLEVVFRYGNVASILKEHLNAMVELRSFRLSWATSSDGIIYRAVGRPKQWRPLLVKNSPSVKGFRNLRSLEMYCLRGLSQEAGTESSELAGLVDVLTACPRLATLGLGISAKYDGTKEQSIYNGVVTCITSRRYLSNELTVSFIERKHCPLLRRLWVSHLTPDLNQWIDSAQDGSLTELVLTDDVRGSGWEDTALSSKLSLYYFLNYVNLEALERNHMSTIMSLSGNCDFKSRWVTSSTQDSVMRADNMDF